MKHDAVFQSERIDFVRLSEALVDDYLTMVNDPGVQRLISHTIRVYDRAGELEWVRQKRLEAAAIYSMLERETGRFIGNIELRDFEAGWAVLGVSITPARQNRGFGTEALRRFLDYSFEQFGLDAVDLKVYSHNPRARHVYEKLGFRVYEIAKHAGEIDGQPFDDIGMRLSKSDFYNSSLA